MSLQTQSDISLEELQSKLNALTMLQDFVEGEESRLEEEVARGGEQGEIDNLLDSLSS